MTGRVAFAAVRALFHNRRTGMAGFRPLTLVVAIGQAFG
jgi:hypothetical protein